MKMKRIISLLLAVVTVIGTISCLGVVNVFAAEGTTSSVNSLTTVFNSAQERVDAMTLYSRVDGYEIYGDAYSGEVAFKDMTSGQILLTNPYGVASSKASTAQKYELLSQIIVKYTDNEKDKTFTSYEQAAMRGQISIEKIKNGIRVEYSLGNESTRLLVPRLINKDRFEDMILSKVSDTKEYKRLLGFYSLKDPSTVKLDILKEQYYAKWPITKEMPVYLIAEDTTEVDLRKIEEIIKKNCPDYTFEQLDYDHTLTKYEGEDRPPANFKMALEYTIDNGQLVVNLPANGIRYNEDEYTLSNIEILPYMGAGINPNEGYTFLPDGSGAIFKFEDLNVENATTVSTTMYGIDYAYQTIMGSYEQTARVPVFGIVENEKIYKTVTLEKEVEVQKDVQTTNAAGETIITTETVKEIQLVATKEFDRNEMRGFAAIIEEGDAMCKLSTYHGGSFHEYNTVKVSVVPRPKDSYNLQSAISVGSNSTWTVVSERRYTGNYKIRYVLLTDEAVAEEKGMQDTYAPSWLGMADAYQDFLVDNEIISKFTEDSVEDNIPVYIETFGAMSTIKKILSIPVTVKVALTTFDDIENMYEALSNDGVSNINFKLTGYANGGMVSTMPYNLKWEKAVGGKDGFKDLVATAKEKGFGVFPDFDFAYLNKKGNFDGVSNKKHVIKSIDNRYTSRRIYSASRQNYATYYQLAMSPAYYYRFIDKFASNYTKYEPIGISVSTLGHTLNSDFDKKEPYNREDSKNFTASAFESLAASYSEVMTEGGNSYVWKYADHILDIPLDSSRYIKASYTVPFIGYVLHGYKNFTGAPINMAGDIRYEVLKCIENGAYMYFILSIDNVELLKEDKELSKYYSIRYDIWYDDVVSLYTELNGILADLQDKEIVGHEFLIGERIPDEDEVPDTEGTGKYKTMDDGRIVKVTYEDGTTFILNYNYFDVTVEGNNVDAFGYVKIN